MRIGNVEFTSWVRLWGAMPSLIAPQNETFVDVPKGGSAGALDAAQTVALEALAARAGEYVGAGRAPKRGRHTGSTGPSSLPGPSTEG